MDFVKAEDSLTVRDWLSQVQDRIGFLINNLSNSNLKQKATELKGHLTEEYWPWFCNYMVVKRAAQEQNFHLLYASLLLDLQVTHSSQDE